MKQDGQFGRYLRYCRKINRMSIAKAAGAVGISPYKLSCFECGEKEFLDLDTLTKLANLYHLSIYERFGDSEKYGNIAISDPIGQYVLAAIRRDQKLLKLVVALVSTYQGRDEDGGANCSEGRPARLGQEDPGGQNIDG